MAGIGVDEGPPYGIIIGICVVIFIYVLHSLYTSWQEKRSAARVVSSKNELTDWALGDMAVILKVKFSNT